MYVKVRPGSVPKQLAADFAQEVNALELAFVKELGTEKEDAYFFIAYHQTSSKQVRELIQKYDFSRANFGKDEGTPAEIIDELDEKIKETYGKKEALQLKAQELAAKRVDLMRLYDALGLSLQRRQASNRCVDTQKTFHLQGWVKSSEQKQLRETLQDVAQVYQLTFSEPEDDEPFPVYTKNVTAVTPFEMVTNLYSVPASDGIDPNNVVAPFHAMFLGLMMADVGYGIILTLAGHFYAKVAKGGAKKIAGVVKYSGLFAIMWGVLLGSYFGDIGSRLGIKALLLDPMEDPVLMLALSLGLGAIHIFVGLGVKAYMLVKEKKYLDALFDVGFWYLVLIGLPLLATPYASVGQWMAIGGLVGLVLTQGRAKKNFFGKLLGGVGSLYDITGYLSDILSYSRLFALLLSTAVVAMVFNQIAFMVGTSWIGFLFAAIVFLIGHAFNLFIGGLGAFVHGSRLIYVEFFSKFFIGGGHAFDPLHKETKYVSLEEKEAM